MSKVRISGLPAELYSPISDDARSVWDYPDGRTYKARPGVIAADVGRRAYADPTATQIATIDPVTGKLRADLTPWATPETFLGFYDADANSPALVDGTGTDGSYYRVNVAGSNTPDGATAYIGDRVLYSSSQGVWKTLHDRAEFDGWRSITDPKYGADPTGVIDSTAAIQAALDDGPGRVYVPSGRYVCSDTIYLRQYVDIECESNTLLDFSGVVDASIDGVRYCVRYSDGSFTKLPDLATDVAAGDSTLEFDSAPSLEPGDIVWVFNPTDFSYSEHIANYREGEAFEVKAVDGTTVTFVGKAYVAHASADVDIYKTSNPYEGTIRGLNIKGINDESYANDGLFIQHGVRLRIENCNISNASATGLLLGMCFDVKLRGCNIADNLQRDYTFALNYGIVVGNTVKFRATDCVFMGGFHGFTTGYVGFGDVCTIPNRHGYVSGCYIASTSDIGANAGFLPHANTEYYTVEGNAIAGGIVIAGDLCSYTNNDVYRDQSVNPQATIFGATMTGASHIIKNNRLYGTNYGTSSDAPILDTRGGIDNTLKRGGTLVFEGNKCHITGAGSHNQNACIFSMRGYDDAKGGISIVFKDNHLVSDGSYAYGVYVANELDVPTASPWELVEVSGNIFENMHGPIITDTTGSDVGSARKVFIERNKILPLFNILRSNNSYQAVGVLEHLEVTGNTFNGGKLYGNIQGPSTTSLDTCIHKNNYYRDTPWQWQTTVRSSVSFRYITNLINDGNIFINTNKVLRVADGTQFEAGNTITGGTSGATATVYDVNGVYLSLRNSISNGPFVASETVTDDVTGNSSTAFAAEIPLMEYDSYYRDIHNAWRGDGNVSTDDTGTPSAVPGGNIGAITNDVTIS